MSRSGDAEIVHVTIVPKLPHVALVEVKIKSLSTALIIASESILVL
jgi:hypothetical protein